MTAARQESAHQESCKLCVRTLYLAFELGADSWVIAFATETGDNARLRTIKAADTVALLREIAQAKGKFKLPANAPVVCCYEAGRDGHWLWRYLNSRKITCHEVDSSSIEVNRRQRRAKTDNLDAAKLLSMLIRYEHGEKNVWRVVNVPSAQDEANRHLHRELEDWIDQRRQHTNRIKSLLATMGLTADVTQDFLERLEQLRMWDGQALPTELQARLRRQFEGWHFADRQINDLENQRKQTIRTASDPGVEIVRKLLQFKGIGVGSAWLFAKEVFAWRQIESARQIGSLAGLTPTPYTSSSSAREQGISKAGNRRLRAMAVEIAWMWVHHQPNTEITKWFLKRFGTGRRLRKIGIVALARKMLVALWRYLKEGIVPPGAVLVEWRGKLVHRKTKELMPAA